MTSAATNPNPTLSGSLVGYDPTGHQEGIAFQVGTVVQDATTGIWYAPLAISGSISATNPSVGATGSGTPASATFVGFGSGGNLTGVDATHGLPVNIVAGSSAGTQYTDGGTPPANPIGTALIFDQSGTWKDVGADQPLPTVQTGALPAGTNVIGHVIVDTAPTTAVTGTFWQTTQPVSIASLPALPANQSINNAQVAGTAVSVNTGTVDAGTQRVTLATDIKVPTNLSQVAGNAIATGNNAVPTLNSAAAGAVAAYGSNAAALTANTDYAFKWGAGGTTQVNHVMIQNNSTVNINVEVDAATNAGSQVLSNTLGQNVLYLDIQMTALHIQGNATPNVNGSSANNIVIRGWL